MFTKEFLLKLYKARKRSICALGAMKDLKDLGINDLQERLNAIRKEHDDLLKTTVDCIMAFVPTELEQKIDITQASLRGYVYSTYSGDTATIHFYPALNIYFKEGWIGIVYDKVNNAVYIDEFKRDLPEEYRKFLVSQIPLVNNRVIEKYLFDVDESSLV